MKSYVFSFIFLSLLTTSCAAIKQSSDLIIWVNSYKVSCEGVAPQTCFEVKFNNDKDWSLFYDIIEGFDFEQGYIYKLSVKEKDLNMEDVPADASSKKYTLLKVLSKTKDTRETINNKWKLTHFKKSEIDSNFDNPTLEINTSTSRVNGRGTCNNYFASIDIVTDNVFILRENLGATKKFCDDANFEMTYFNSLRSVNSYKLKDSKLFLFDVDNNEILRFTKE